MPVDKRSTTSSIPLGASCARLANTAAAKAVLDRDQPDEVVILLVANNTASIEHLSAGQTVGPSIRTHWMLAQAALKLLSEG